MGYDRAMFGAKTASVRASKPTRRTALRTPWDDVAAGAHLGRLARAPSFLDTKSVLALQRWAGNSAVRGLLPPVQRAPRDKDDDPDPKGYTTAAGKADVEGSGTTRREVHGLTYGLTGGFKGTYTSRNYPKGIASEESSMTTESPDNMAVVIMPDKMVANQPAKEGALADALRASADPTIDRASGLPCEAPKPKAKSDKKRAPKSDE
jgi:hypothetical protein